MKKFIRCISLIIVAIMLVSVVGCNSNEVPPEIVETDRVFYENGTTNYVIVIADDATDNEIFAADELQELFKTATGAELIIKTERALTKKEPYISLGYTNVLKSTDINLSEAKLGISGYRIENRDNNVYIFGDSEENNEGVVFGVYKFLNAMVGYVYYSDLNIYFDAQEKIMLKEFHVTDIPDFQKRYVNTLTCNVSRTYRTRMRYTSRNDISGTVIGHSAFKIVSPDVYYEDHPDWFSRDAEEGKKPSQLCYSSEGMFEQYVINLKEAILKEPDRSTYQLNWEDNVKYCECEKCIAALEKYGNYGGINIVFVNKVAAAIQEWIKGVQPGRKLTFKTYGYYATEQAPVVKNADGSYSPLSDEVIARDDVSVVIWLLFTKLWHKPLDHAENTYGYDVYKQWTTVCSNVEAGNYAANFWPGGYMYSLNDFSAIERDMELFYEMGVNEVLYTFGYQVTNIAPFFDLRAYCLSNLMWDSSLSYEELANDFIEKNYLDAAPIFKEYYNTYKSWMNSLELTDIQTSKGYMIKSDKFPIAIVDNFYTKLEDVQNVAEKYKDMDIQSYERISASVRKEKIMPLYMYIDLYTNNFNLQEIKQMIDDFEAYTLEFKVLLYGENFFLRDALAGWREKLNMEV